MHLHALEFSVQVHRDQRKRKSASLVVTRLKCPVISDKETP